MANAFPWYWQPRRVAVSILEAVTAADIYPAVTAVRLQEAVAAFDVFSITSIYTATLLESVSAADTYFAGIAFLQSISEQVSASDMFGGAGAISLVETLTPVDAFTGAQVQRFLRYATGSRRAEVDAPQRIVDQPNSFRIIN